MKYFSNFPFIQERYKNGFYTNLINKYFVLLCYFSTKSNVKPEDLINKALMLLFTEDINKLNKYDAEIIYGLISKKDKEKLLDKAEFLKLESDDCFILLAIFIYLREAGLIEEKKVQFIYFIKLLYLLNWFSSDNLPVIKIWQLATTGVFLTPVSIGDLHAWINKHKIELRKKIYHGQEGKLLKISSINILIDYEQFIIDFLKIKDIFITGPMKSLVNNYFNSYRTELQFVNQIRELIKTGTI